MDQTAVDAYLQRIACPRPIRPDAAALRQIHLRSIERAAKVRPLRVAAPAPHPMIALRRSAN